MSDRLDRAKVESLVEGSLSWDELQDEILPDPKDPDRFEAVIEVLEESVEWDEPILVPLNDHLFVVSTDDGRKVKTACGEVLCDAAENWKRATQIRVRDDKESFSDVYPKEQTADPEWSFQLREFYCPDCFALLEVQAAPAGYPARQKFEPDIDTFYEEWLNKPVPE